MRLACFLLPLEPRKALMNAHKVEIYTKQGCQYSENARAYLNARGIAFKDIDVAAREAREEMIARSGGRETTPQIFLEGEHIGGYDDMVQGGLLERFRQS